MPSIRRIRSMLLKSSSDYFIQAFIYLCAAVIAVPIAKRLGLGSVLGYLIAGVIIGPVTGLVGSETTTIQHFAEFGVVMMLELEPRMLWEMRSGRPHQKTIKNRETDVAVPLLN